MSFWGWVLALVVAILICEFLEFLMHAGRRAIGRSRPVRRRRARRTGRGLPTYPVGRNGFVHERTAMGLPRLGDEDPDV